LKNEEKVDDDPENFPSCDRFCGEHFAAGRSRAERCTDHPAAPEETRCRHHACETSAGSKDDNNGARNDR
jgi:hypothetical protein